MSGSIKGRIDRYYDEMVEARNKEDTKNKPLIDCGILDFCKDWLGFTPYPYQEKLLLDSAQFIVARWSRQSGKSHTIGAKLLYNALTRPGIKAVVLAPSLRQSRKDIGKMRSFARRAVRKGLDVFEDKNTTTKVVVRNGSSIEALPNNPATIRGDTVHIIYADELNYIQNAEELYDAMIFTLNTTNGRFIGTSTPGSRDSLFYKMCMDDVKFKGFSRHQVRFREALEPNGPLKPEIVERIKQQLNEDPWRWQREMEADFAEDEDAWFGLSLIERCVVQDIKTFDDPETVPSSFPTKGVFYAGCDLGKKRDHSAVAVVEKTSEGELRLVHLRSFRQDRIRRDRKSTRLNSSHVRISYAVFCLKNKTTKLNSSHVRISYAVFCSEKKQTSIRLASTRDPMSCHCVKSLYTDRRITAEHLSSCVDV